MVEVQLSSCRLGIGKLKELQQCLAENTFAKKIDLSSRGLKEPESSARTLKKILVDNPNITWIDAKYNGVGDRSTKYIEDLLKVNLNLTRFDVHEQVFQTTDRASLARCLQSIHWLLNSNYAYQLFKAGKSTNLVLSGRSYQQLVPRLLEGAERVQYFDISHNELTALPDLIQHLTLVQQFIAHHNQLTEIPGPAFAYFDRLLKLDLSHNHLTKIPEEITELVNVQEFFCSHNELTEIPELIKLMQSLRRVDFSHNKISALPGEFTLDHLEILLVNNNNLTILPDSILLLQKIKVLNISNNRISAFPSGVEEHQIQMHLIQEIDISNNNFTIIPTYFGNFKLLKKINISNNKIAKLPNEITNLRNVEELYINNNSITGLPDLMGNLWKLTVLHGQYNKITHLPETFQLLRYLKYLDLSNNRLKIMDNFLCTLVSLQILKIYKNEPFKGMPPEILAKAEKAEMEKEKRERRVREGKPARKANEPEEIENLNISLDFIKQLPVVPQSASRMKLMFVGKEGVGKTSLFECFRLKVSKQQRKKKDVFEPEPTNGIIVDNFKFKDVNFSAWDFSGKDEFINTHQLFFSDRSIYILVCNMMDPESEDDVIEHWLELITRKVGNQSPIIIVGTHLDDKACGAKYRKTFWARIKSKVSNRFPSVVSYEVVGARHNKKVDSVIERVLKVSSQQSYIPQQVMSGYQYLEDRIKLLNDLMKTPMTSMKRFTDEVTACGIKIDCVPEAMKYLNDIGVLVHFGDICPSLVFLNPQWIANLISTFTHIKKYAHKGLFDHF